MGMTQLSYRPHRFPPSVIQHAIWLYLRFTLSCRDVEDLLAERGLDVSYETVRRCVLKFGPAMAAAIDGTSTRWSSASPASGCTCGAPSIMRERSSICW